MSLQTNVGLRQSAGVPGDKATLGLFEYTVGTPLADGPVTAGQFVWPAAREGFVTAQGANGVSPLGLVERNLAGSVMLERGAGGSMVYPAGSALNVVRRGTMMVVADAAAVAGDLVYAAISDGAVLTAPMGAAAPSGAVRAEGWVVARGGAAGSLLFISNWSK